MATRSIALWENQTNNYTHLSMYPDFAFQVIAFDCIDFFMLWIIAGPTLHRNNIFGVYVRIVCIFDLGMNPPIFSWAVSWCVQEDGRTAWIDEWKVINVDSLANTAAPDAVSLLFGPLHAV